MDERLRAPVEQGGVLIRPDIHQLKQVVAENRDILREMDFVIAGRGAREIRRDLRAKVLGLARDYTRELHPGETVPEPDAEAPLIVTGHQPEIFHAGVWFKHHLTGRLARAVGGVPLSLVLETDVPDLLGLRVPVRTGDDVRVRDYNYAPVSPGRTWEEHRPDGSWRVDEFVEEVTGVLPVKGGRSLFPEFGARLKEARGLARNAADLVTRARSGLEHEAGLTNLEVCASRVCSTAEFMLFVLAIAVDLERFRNSHNEALGLYRQAHRLRGGANPMPDLGPGEAPFWAYTRSGVRSALMVERENDGLALVLEKEPFFVVDKRMLARMRAGEAGAFDEAAGAALARTTETGVRIRTRALTTTMLLRLFVADVFVHGIGGTKYDSITDRIIGDFFGVTAPGFITASATLRLPFETFPGTEEEAHRLERLMRDLQFNPDRHVAKGAGEREDARRLIRRKQELIALDRRNTPAGRREVFEAIRSVNGELHGLAAQEERSVREKLARTQRETALNRILTGREYAFVLFDREGLLGFYERALATVK